MTFYRPNGWVFPQVPAAPAMPDDPVGEVQAANASNGVQVDPHTLKPIWSGEPFDLGWAIDVLHPRANPLTDRAAPPSQPAASEATPGDETERKRKEEPEG